jgi:hypothetical protein
MMVAQITANLAQLMNGASALKTGRGNYEGPSTPVATPRILGAYNPSRMRCRLADNQTPDHGKSLDTLVLGLTETNSFTRLLPSWPFSDPSSSPTAVHVMHDALLPQMAWKWPQQAYAHGQSFFG